MTPESPSRRSLLRTAALGAGAFAAGPLATLASQAASAETPDPATILKTLKAGHPRLMVMDSDIAEVKRLIETDPIAKRSYESLIQQGTKMLDEPPVEYKLIGPRLLDKSRTCIARVYTLATLYRLDGDKKWRDRAVKEMLAVAAFPDWHPPHFLDVAEMTHGVSIGYDWLYNSLTPEERATIKTAIVNFGLKPGEMVYKGDPAAKGFSFWKTAIHNWNQVCNGGLSLGALAVADEEPELAAYIITSALKSLPYAMASFAPDGGWAEGPGYWSFTVRYTVPLIASLTSALGTDFNLATTNGFDRTGTFRLYFVGPTTQTFNYADAGAGLEHAPDLHWLAKRFHEPIYDWTAEQAAEARADAMDLLWYTPATVGPKAAKAPLDNIFRGVNVVFLRSAWEDKNALWVGFKGGNNAANHAHLDLGTFAFDALGERWAHCIGPDNYNLPDYFGKLRWNYYRLRTEGQNTVLINGENQDIKAKAPIVAYSSKPDQTYAVAELTEGYKHLGLTKVHRGVALVSNRSGLLVQDEIEAPMPVDFQWQIHTRATIAANGRTATLTQNKKTLTVTLLHAPEGAVFGEASAAPPPINNGEGPQQNPNKGFRRLIVKLPEKTSNARVAVLLAPQSAGELKPDLPESLTDWISAAPPLPKLGGSLT